MNTLHFTRILFFTCLLLAIKTQAQVPVSKEPFHRLVFQNQYIRLLDVVLAPGDTTQFHIHSTPSLFVHLSRTKVSSQVKGQTWMNEENTPGTARYRSFDPDILVHRVTNFDTVPFHVTDIELLSPFSKVPVAETKYFPFNLLFENEKARAYQITDQNILTKPLSNARPLVAELAIGDAVFYHDAKAKQSKEIKQGGFLYIEPGNTFYFTANNGKDINMVLFELK